MLRAMEIVRMGWPRAWAWTCYGCGHGGGQQDNPQNGYSGGDALGERRAFRWAVTKAYAHLNENTDCPLARLFQGKEVA